MRSTRFAEIARTRAEQQRARAEQQRRQASEERLRIARELHDVLGHHLSLINVQAGVGLHLMDDRPEQARASLLAIKQASAEALREVRSVLGVLRAGGRTGAPRPGAQPGQPRRAGGDRRCPAGGTRASRASCRRSWTGPAYRIVQEALTNVRRHAGPDGDARRSPSGTPPAELSLVIEDDGQGAPGRARRRGPDGNGIAGMRARATALGGTLAAGPPGGRVPGGGATARWEAR